MKKKNKELKIIEEDHSITRRDFLKTGITLAATLVVPKFLMNCSDTKTGKNSAHYASFEIRFSKQMNIESVANNLTISPNQPEFTLVEPEWTENNTVLYCKYPTEAAGKEFNITISGEATDLVGNQLDGNSDGTGGDAYTFSVVSV